ncbi:MAG: type II toxin-antitoxin system RelE/ParE family toxin [Alteraurantiacibacter sp. bin_em_oilr2.035]|nr:type II toxin-antitoxin system RelE/ParE family toxin [Alteraurantiacibacter sp. bin_em_oilr2.035]
MIYEISRKALRQIEDIIRYTDENFGESQTDVYIGGLYNSFEILSDNPHMGVQYDQRRRRYIYRSHQVYYRVLKDRVLIVDIRNSRQSPPEVGR